MASAHDCSEGGLLVAAAEMAFAGRIGLDLDLTNLPVAGEPNLAAKCFAENPARYLLEVAPADLDAAIRGLRDAGVPFAQVGTFAGHDRLTLRAADGPEGRRRARHAARSLARHAGLLNAPYCLPVGSPPLRTSNFELPNFPPCRPNVSKNKIDGCTVHGLRSDAVELTVCPERGMRVIDFTDRRTGRRWFWSPPTEADGVTRLPRNRAGDAFDASPLVGMDECLPGVSPCPTSPDHGEVWPRAASLLDDATRTLRTRVSLPGCGLDLERAINLEGDEARFDYRLTNPGKERRAYLWAAHPLLTVMPGDGIELPEGVSRVHVAEGAGVRGLPRDASAPWPRLTPMADAAALRLNADRSPALVKCFASGFTRGETGIRNPQTGDRLSLRFDAEQLGALRVWINRGHWKGFQQIALSPTNAPVETRSEAAALNVDATHVGPGETRIWGWVLRTHPMKTG